MAAAADNRASSSASTAAGTPPPCIHSASAANWPSAHASARTSARGPATPRARNLGTMRAAASGPHMPPHSLMRLTGVRAPWYAGAALTSWRVSR